MLTLVYTFVYTLYMKTTIRTKVTAWGNSYGLRLPKEFVESSGLSKKTFSVFLDPKEKKIILEEEKTEHSISKEWFKQALKKMKPMAFKNKETELDWGSPVGKEIW